MGQHESVLVSRSRTNKDLLEGRAEIVVLTGVKSAGCENRIAHFPSNHLWKSMSPCVVFAWKLGASEPNRKRGCSAGVARNRLKIGLACRLAKEDGVAIGVKREAWEVARRMLRVKVAMLRY